MTWPGVIDVGYRDVQDPRDDFPPEKPTREEWDDRIEYACPWCGDVSLVDPADPVCSMCGLAAE